MKKIMMVVCFASIIFATASCDSKNENCNLRNAEQSSPLQTVESPDTFAPLEAIPLLPVATAEMFDLNEVDTALFYGALTKDMPYSSGRGVTFPYVGIYDTYNNEETTNYICYVAYMRYDIDDSSRSLMYAGTKMTYGRAILVQDENGGYSCEAFELLGDGEGWSEKLREYCGPLTELPSAIMDGSINYSSTFPDDMCEQYCILADAIVKE